MNKTKVWSTNLNYFDLICLIFSFDLSIPGTCLSCPICEEGKMGGLFCSFERNRMWDHVWGEVASCGLWREREWVSENSLVAGVRCKCTTVPALQLLLSNLWDMKGEGEKKAHFCAIFFYIIFYFSNPCSSSKNWTLIHRGSYLVLFHFCFHWWDSNSWSAIVGVNPLPLNHTTTMHFCPFCDVIL